MKIPLLDYYISNENFNTIKDFENFNLVVKRIDNYIKIYFKLTYSIDIFIANESNNFYIFFNPEFCKEFNENNIVLNKNLWKELYIYKDHYEFINDNSNKFEDIELNSYEAKQIIFNWIKKYKYIISNINPNNLVIDLSAGFDTRALTYFWKDNNQKYSIYTKPDERELIEALTIINQLPYKEYAYNFDEFKYIDNTNYIRLTGGSNIHRNKYVDKECWLNEIGNPLFQQKKWYNCLVNLCPYYDKEYLRIYSKELSKLKKIFINYFLLKDCNLYKYPYKSFKKEFFQFNDFWIKKCENIITNWNNYNI